jgi:hypothetical protein
MKRLKDTLWKVATEYAMKVGELIEQEPEFWVAEDISVDCCCFGDVWFLTLEDMQVIIDHMPKWLERYGNRKAVAQEITDWLDWSIEDGYDPDRDQYRRHARINLWSWLKGLRPADLKVTVDDEIQQHRDILSVLGTVRGSYGGGITIGQAVTAIHGRLVELEARKRIEDESAFEKIKDTEAYKHFRKMMEDEA